MPWFAFPKSVLSKPIVWLVEYAFISKSDSRLCGCLVFDQSIGRFFGLMRITFGFKQCPRLLLQKKCTLYADCVAERLCFHLKK